MPVRILGLGSVANELLYFLTQEGYDAHIISLEDAMACQNFAQYQYLVCLPGNMNLRMLAIQWLESHDLHSPIYQHPSAIVYGCDIGPGAIIFCMTAVQRAVLGAHCQISTMATVSHGCQIGQGTVVLPYACLLGSAQVARYCVLQTRSTINDRVRITADYVVILPMTFVTKDITEAGTYGGLSSRQINQNTALDLA